MTPRARNLRAAIVTLIALAACAVVLAHNRLDASRESLAAALEAHSETLARARRVHDLRARAEFVADRPRPEPDLVARLVAQLERIGAPASALAGVSMRSAAIRAEEGLVRQTAEIRLAGLDAGKTARLLAAWREREPTWTIAAVRLQHAGRNPSSVAAESFDIRLTLECVHWTSDATPREGAPS